MDILDIKKIAQSSQMQAVGIKNKYSVFIPIIKIDGELHILYEVRALSLRNQPGEISFPGGRIEADENFVDAAVRETCEELLLLESDLEVYSKGDFLVNPYSAIIYSVVGEIKKPFNEIIPSKDEVDSLFAVPVKYFLENKPDVYELDLKVTEKNEFPYDLIPNGRNYKFKRGIDQVCFYEFEDKIIWGFTAKMTYEFIKKLKRAKID